MNKKTVMQLTAQLSAFGDAYWRMKFKLSPDARYIPKRSPQIKNRRRKKHR